MQQLLGPISHKAPCALTNQSEDLGSRAGSAGPYDVKQKSDWLRAHIISSFKPSQTPAPTSLIDKGLLGAPLFLLLQHLFHVFICLPPATLPFSASCLSAP